MAEPRTVRENANSLTSELFQNDRVKTGSCGIQCGRIPTRTAADNHDIIHICHTDLPHSARAFFSEIHQFPSQRKGRSENLPQPH